MAVHSVPGLVQGRGPSKNNFQNFIQREPWQGGGVAGGGQARTGHGNWFQSMIPKMSNNRNSVILSTTPIPGEDDNTGISGSSIKSRGGKRGKGRSIYGLTPYAMEDQIDRMEMGSMASSTPSEIGARHRALNEYALEQGKLAREGGYDEESSGIPSSPAPPSITGMYSDPGSVVAGGGVQEPMIDTTQMTTNENVGENLAAGLMENVDIANAMSLSPQNTVLPTIDTQGPNSFYSGLVSPRTQIDTAYQQASSSSEILPTTSISGRKGGNYGMSEDVEMIGVPQRKGTSRSFKKRLKSRINKKI